MHEFEFSEILKSAHLVAIQRKISSKRWVHTSNSIYHEYIYIYTCINIVWYARMCVCELLTKYYINPLTP